ncbi:efflux RND transporter permease subunit [Paucibacter sp. DJ2R-2]|uniref:efflux RND transporter permease subunit n=1 Tax=Paucibacter sp. DJ2R-2 TaxID=2893558 RepID=UPI0021E49FD0|nr:CusA/CzcA family heavy metal efflux RND transporter [Paucibacter sp. DJ2R-2]MCV2438665.1 CusA/CzcA family heavy metal efflux RND transporter [Paucibacter sp. DJ2R-2]
MNTDRLIARVIRASLNHGRWVVLTVAMLGAIATALAWQLKLDALPDLSDTQVILKVEAPGQPPRQVEDQTVYPITSTLPGIPGAATVRAVSMFGEAFIYVVFHDGVSPAEARAAVQQRMSQLQSALPSGSKVALGPDAAGTGWIYQYVLTGPLPLDRLRALQDTVVRPALQSLSGVAEVASIGGSARQLQIELDPIRATALGITPESVSQGLRDANQLRGGGAMEVGRQRTVIAMDARTTGPQDISNAVVGQDSAGQPVRLGQVARASWGPAPREGVADLDGRGDAAGGIVVMRQGENAERTLRAVHERVAKLQSSLPKDVALEVTYDRSTLIHASVKSLASRLLEEGVVVCVVCLIFLRRLRSALVAVLSLPVGLLVALAVLERQGITANIMSMGGLAIAVGAMIDAAVVMVETLHRKLEQPGAGMSHRALVLEAAQEVGPALFFSLLVITVSFLPVFSLQGPEGRLFTPLALTKTYAMAAAAALAVTLVPVLMAQFVRGPVQPELGNPINRILQAGYRPLLRVALAYPRRTIAVSALATLTMLWPLAHLGSEFMPSLDEGDLLYMPTTLPSVAVDEAADILSRTSALIRQQPEVASVHGKAGRSDSATDPAPISMLETTVRLKPRAEWPDPSLPMAALITRLDAELRLPGLAASWGHPIRTRIDMLASGSRTPLALRVTAPDAAHAARVALEAEALLQHVPGVRRAVAERSAQGRFLELHLDRARLSQAGLRAADVAQWVAGPAGGGEVVDVLSIGRERVPVVVRLPRADRDSIQALGRLQLLSSSGAIVPLAEVAELRLTEGPSELKTENGQPVADVQLDLDSADTGAVLAHARLALQELEARHDGSQLTFVGQQLRLTEGRWRLAAISAATLALVAGILALHFHCARCVAIVLTSLPAAAAGAFWLCWLLGLQWSFAVAVGLLALAGLAAEFCVVMLLYLDQERSRHPELSLAEAVTRGALLRLRPKAMTVAVILGGLLPLLWSDGVGVDVMRRIATPLVGGMLTAPLYVLLVVPAMYAWVVRR